MADDKLKTTLQGRIAKGRIPPVGRLMRPVLRGKYAREIAELDPEHDYERIGFLLTCYEFPWDIERALEFALFRTYAVPSISGRLHRTGEFSRRPRKRYDDTELLLAEIMENGFDSEPGRAALQRINAMHGRFPIANRDFIYVLTTFVFEPIRWIERFGWRPLTADEKQAIFSYYRQLGHRMNITDIPEDLEALEEYNREFERKRFRYSETNHQIGGITRDLLLSFYVPRFLISTARPFAHALMDVPLLEAMGFPEPPALLRSIMTGALKLRGRLLRWLPPRRRPHLITEVRRPTYPEGYKIEALGTFTK